MSSITRPYNKCLVLGIFLVALLLIDGRHTVDADNDNDDDDDIERQPAVDSSQLPSLWAAAESGRYHVLYQLEMKGSIELIEEWANFNKRQFRLDLIGHGGTRTSFLTSVHTGETFRYKPFECSRIDDGKIFDDLSLIAPLFVGHPWDDQLKSTDAYMVYGLGPLWLRAYKEGKKIDSSSSSNTSNHNSHDNVIQTLLPFEDRFNVYELELGPDVTHTQQPYKLRFYFAKSGRPEFVDTVDWILSEHSGDDETTKRDEEFQVRAKVIQADYQSPIDPSVFKIPVGYGCSRRLSLDPILQIDIGMVLLHQGAPSQAAFEVTVSHPNDDSLQAASWISQRHSVRALRLSQSVPGNASKTESYFVTLSQFRELRPSASKDKLKPVMPASSNSKLKRIKQVWWSPDSYEGLATVYTIDQSTGECKVDHQDLRNQVLLTFGSSSPNSDDDDDAKGPLVLSLDKIAMLLEGFGSYHLIDEGEQIGAASLNKFRNRFYERRFEHYELKSADGQVAWSGPVSIVKQISTYSQYLDINEDDRASKQSTFAAKQSLTLSRDFKIKLIMFFYSANHDRLLFKVVIDLLDNHEVSYSYAQQQMDVSSCFRPETKQDIVIKYPLGSVSLSRELESKREEIKLLVGESLFWHNQLNFLTPLHVYNIQPSFDPFYMRLQMSLVDLPLTTTYQLERDQKLVADPTLNWAEARSALVELTSSNAELCGENCAYHNCFTFSYDPIGRSCQVALDPGKTKRAPSQASELYTYFDRRHPIESFLKQNSKWPDSLRKYFYEHAYERVHLSSNAMVEFFEELVSEAQSSSSTNQDDVSAINPLIIRVNMKPEVDSIGKPAILDNKDKTDQVIALVPSAVEHNMETMNEYSRELEMGNDDSSVTSGGQTELVRVRGDKQLRLEYRILLNDRTFSKYLDETLTGVTYEDCERHCELNDCRSFSYCLFDESCQISGQHNEKYLRANSRQTHDNKGCNIYSLNYLTKFEPYGLMPEPDEKQVAAKGMVAISESDCAIACMDHQGFTCQSFYLCRRTPSQLAPGDGSAECLLMDEPAGVIIRQNSELPLAPKQPKPLVQRPLLDLDGSDSTTGKSDVNGSSTPGRQCSFFSRSYLAQFDKYLGKRINMDGVEQRIKVQDTLQDCAKHCLKAKCLAFDACPTNGMFGGIICNLRVDSIKRDQLLPERKCTTFVVADKSHFNSKKLKLIYGDSSTKLDKQQTNEQTLGKPDKVANIDDDDDDGARDKVEEAADSSGRPTEGEQELQQADLAGTKLKILEDYRRSQGHHYHHNQPAVAGHCWLARLLSLCLGILLGGGLILGWNEAYARGWLSDRFQMLTPNALRAGGRV